MYRLRFHEEALREWEALDKGVRVALKKKLERRLEEPHVPVDRLHGDLAHCYKIRHAKTGHRLVYSVSDDELLVSVVAVGQRDKLAVYREARRRG